MVRRPSPSPPPYRTPGARRIGTSCRRPSSGRNLPRPQRTRQPSRTGSRRAASRSTDTPANRHFIAAPGHCEAGGGRVPNDPEHLPGVGSGRPGSLDDPQRSGSIAGNISGAIGIDESDKFVHTNTVIDKNAPPRAGFRNAPPLSTYWAQFVSPYAYPTGFTESIDPATAPWTVRGYTPAQIKGAYGIAAHTTARARRWPSSTPTLHRRFCRTSTSGRPTADCRR